MPPTASQVVENKFAVTVSAAAFKAVELLVVERFVVFKSYMDMARRNI